MQCSGTPLSLCFGIKHYSKTVKPTISEVGSANSKIRLLIPLITKFYYFFKCSQTLIQFPKVNLNLVAQNEILQRCQ